MASPLAEVVRFESANGLELSGLLFAASGSNSPLVIHVHGACGNFLSFRPVLNQAAYFAAHGISFFSINTSAHGCIVEGWRGKAYTYLGGSIVPFEECVSDISGAVRFASRLSRRIILQGHSLGCDRVVHYQMSSHDAFDTILLSPSDSYRLHSIFLSPESVDSQRFRLHQLPPSDRLELLPSEEYGVRIHGEDYRIPVTRDVLLSIIDGAPFNLFRLDHPKNYFINARCIACIGGRDPLQVRPPQAMFGLLRSRFLAFEDFLVPHGDHELEPEAERAFERLVAWVLEGASGHR